MKQEFFRLLRRDHSLFIEPMKRWFRSFGFDFVDELTGSAGGNQGPSDPESNEVIGPPGEAVVRGTSPYREPALVDPCDGQLDPELVRNVFTAANTPAEYSTHSENPQQFADRTAVSDDEEAAAEEGSSPEVAAAVADPTAKAFLEEPEAEADSTQQPQDRPRFGPDSEASSGHDVVARSAATPKPSPDAPSPTLVRTMVETIAERTPVAEQVLDLLPDGLEGLFMRNARINVGVKTLLQNLEPADLRELTEELNEFARTIGAIDRPA